MTELRTSTRWIRWISLLGLLALAGLMAGQMIRLPLWGYRPLLLLVSIWGSLQLILFPWIYRGISPIRHWCLSSLAGILMYLGFPDMPLTLLMMVGLVPLLLIENERNDSRFFGGSVYYFNAFLLWNITSVFWLMNTDFAASIFTFLLNAFLMTLAFLLYAYLHRTLGKRYQLPILAAVWICFEQFHLAWDISFPWLQLGNALSMYPILAQWYEYTGVSGGTLWIIALNVLVYQAISADTSYRRDITRILAVLTIPVAISIVLSFRPVPQEDVTRVSIIQPNFEPHFEKFDVAQIVQVERHLSLARKHIDSTDLIVFPETSFGLIMLSDIHKYRTMQRVQELLSEYPRVSFLIGLDAGDFTTELDRSQHVRPYTSRDGSTLYWKRYNAALMLRENINDYQLYKKSKLVPGAEKLPYRKALPFMESFISGLGGSVYGLEGQERRSLLSAAGTQVGAVICYESVYGQYVSEYTRAGAEILAIITNDGWWDDTPGHRQHLRFATLRAIEQRKYIVRSANSGISAIISPKGAIISPTAYDEAAVVHGKVYPNRVITFYTRWGDLIPRISIFLLICLAFGVLRSTLGNRLGR